MQCAGIAPRSDADEMLMVAMLLLRSLYLIDHSLGGVLVVAKMLNILDI